MYEINKIYQKHVINELKVLTNHDNVPLNQDKVAVKILAFLSDLGNVGEESHCFSFWDQSNIDNVALFDEYVEGLSMLLSVGFELKIDKLKDYQEISNNDSLIDCFYKVYQSALKINQSYAFEDYQNTIDDYFTLGFKLGFSIDEILEKYANK